MGNTVPPPLYRQSQWQNLYEHLYKMFVATREVLLVVNCAVVCMWADKFSQDFRGLSEQSKKDTICRWRKYYGITRRRRTHTAQLLPADIEARMKGFFAMLRALKGAHVIVCGDETFLLTEATGDHTYAKQPSAASLHCDYNDSVYIVLLTPFEDTSRTI